MHFMQASELFLHDKTKTVGKTTKNTKSYSFCANYFVKFDKEMKTTKLETIGNNLLSI